MSWAAPCHTNPTNNNFPPDASISPNNQSVGEVTISGNGTRNPVTVQLNGNPSRGDTFSWVQVSGPTVTLTGANTDRASFVAPQVGQLGATLVFRLTASCNNLSNSEETTINITNINSAPTADAGVDHIALEGDSVTLAGTGSDPDGDSLTYSWVQTGGPLVELSGTGAVRSFTAPNVGVGGTTLTFRLSAFDGSLTAVDDKIVNVIWVNEPPEPILSCTPDLVPEGDQVTLDGSGSIDNDDGIASYKWEQLYGPPEAPLVGGTNETATFWAPQLGQGQNATLTFKLTVKDVNGLSSSEKCSVTILDVTPPSVTVPADIVAEAASPDGASISYSASAFDLRDGDLTPSCKRASGSQFPIGTTTVQCTAADAAGNAASATFKVTVQDTTPPALTAAGNVIVEATGPDGATASFPNSSATDAVGPVTVACSPGSGSQFPIGDTTVTCTAKDFYNNSSTTAFLVGVVDTTAPMISGTPSNITVEATGALGAVATWSTPTASDVVDGNRTVNCIPASGSTFAVGTNPVTCSASDTRGNSATSSFNVIVTDTTPPAITLPANITQEATGANGAIVTFAATATDIVEGPVPVSCAPASGSPFALGTTTVTCSATDSRTNTASRTFTVTVQDTTPPTLTLPADITAEATSASGTSVPFTATAVDLVAGNVLATCTPASGATFPLATTQVSCSASDNHNNTATGSFTVTVRDTTPPVIAAHGAVTEEATSSAGALVSYTSPATSDAVDGAGVATCTLASGSQFVLGATTVTCTAKDAAGNVATPTTFVVTVRDTTAPVIAAHAPVIEEATSGAGALVSYTSPGTTDAVDGPGTATCSPVSGSQFALGNTTVNCTAKDAAGNIAAPTSFVVTVRDTTAPVIAPHGPVVAEATSSAGAVVNYTSPGTMDAVDGPKVASCSPLSGTQFALGDTTVTCTAKDAANNSALPTTFVVTVRDTTAPIIAPHAPVFEEATSAAGAIVSYTSPGTTDAVDGAKVATCSPLSGAQFALGDTTVTCIAKDAAGNSAVPTTFVVTVRDTTPPVITVPGNVSATATGPSGALVNFSTSALDIVDGNVAVTCSPASGATFAPGTTTVTCTAKDARNNSTSRTFDVWVKYNWTGFFNPINNNALNTVKAGQAIPVKFSLGGNMGMDIFMANYPRVVGASCSSAVDEITEAETLTAGGSSLQYDASANQYIYVWKSEKSWTNLCLQLQVKLKDGTVHVANFGFTK